MNSLSSRVLSLFATAVFLHAAFSTYEHLSRLKVLERPEGSLPRDIVYEVLFALALGIAGASIQSNDLKEVTWRAEMRKRSLNQVINPSLTFPSYEKEKLQKE